MIEINVHDSFYEIGSKDEKIRAAFVEFGFKPMANDLVFNTVGKTIALKDALNHINKTIEETETFLKTKGIEAKIHE